MNSLRRLLALLGTTVTAVWLAVLLPATAWAADHPTVVAAGTDLARRRYSYRASGGVLGCGALCCLLFVGILVLSVLLIVRRRRGQGQR